MWLVKKKSLNSIDSLFNEVINNGETYLNGLGMHRLKADMFESNDAISIVIDVPGIVKQDIQLDYEKGVVTVSVNREKKQVGENENQIKNTIKTLLEKTSKDINNDYDEFLKNISKYGIITSNIAPYDKLVSEENMVKNFVDVIESINDFK